MYRMEITLSTLGGQTVEEAILENKDLYFLNCSQHALLRQFYESGYITANTPYTLHVLFEKEGEYEDSDETGIMFVYDEHEYQTKVVTEDGFIFNI